ncbi:hypothetical protein CDIK_3448 [Cucumispora dikerogammari]|nr:hypothetical protein CDIK_3448 [Cucumispora dikerogammari]
MFFSFYIKFTEVGSLRNRVDEVFRLTEVKDSLPSIQKNLRKKYNYGSLTPERMKADPVVLSEKLPSVDEKSRQRRSIGQVPNNQFNTIDPILPECLNDPYVK